VHAVVDVTGPADFCSTGDPDRTSVGSIRRATIACLPARHKQLRDGDALPDRHDRSHRLALGRRDSITTVVAAASICSARQSAAAADGRGNADTSPPPIDHVGIKKIDDHTFEVDRELVRTLVSGSVKPGGCASCRSAKDGKLEGLRVYGVKTRRSPASSLEEGDIIRRSTTTDQEPQSLLDVYAQLDTLNTVEIDGKRGDKPLGLTLRLR